MKFDSEILSYLSGEKFSKGLKVKISEKEKTIPLRMEYIEKLVVNKQIIHLGCADHIPLIKEKIRRNKWFHKRLVESSRYCLGIDINREAIEYIKNELGYSDVLVADIQKNDLIKEISSQKWDYLIMGELLEHLDDPVDFLKTIKEKYSPFISYLIVSAPNALRIENYYNSKKQLEVINSDHRFWFTPYTLAKILYRAGFEIESYQFCQGFKLQVNQVFKKRLLRKYPAFRDTIIMIAKF